MSQSSPVALNAPGAKSDHIRLKELLSVEALFDCKGRRFLKLRGKPEIGRPVSAFAFGPAAHHYSNVKVGDPLCAVVTKSCKGNRTFIKLRDRLPVPQLSLPLPLAA